jgi:hypothetical protein
MQTLVDDDIVLMNNNGWSGAELLSYRWYGKYKTLAMLQPLRIGFNALDDFQEHGVVVFLKFEYCIK